jgi:putative SOS response-associated peptidase YedK
VEARLCDASMPSPADSFYECHKIRPKNNPKYEIALTGGKPFAFAGLWGPGTNRGPLTA